MNKNKVKKCCEGCGREITCDASDIFPLCQDCDNESDKNKSLRRKEEHPYDYYR